MKRILLIVLGIILICAVSITFTALADDDLTPIEQLGKAIFFDENLSVNNNQSCASCHGPEAGWTGPLSETNNTTAVYHGSILDKFGDRKPPSAAYATLSPIFYMDKHGLFTGGNFWDGRATGEKLGNPAADQAQGPFLNPVEQALPDEMSVVSIVLSSSYGDLFEELWGPVDTANSTQVAAAFDNIALSIAAYEASSEVNAFTSKYDQTKGGKVKLTKQEQRGLALFKGKGKCSNCHTINGKEPLLTDFTYDNLGIPQNPENPAGVTPDFVDPGLGGFLMNAGYPAEVYMAEWGKHKVPTLRNVDLRPDGEFVKAYGHNGYFKSLEEIVHFYNTRDVEGATWEGLPWPEPEYAATMNTDELGDLGLSPDEEAAIVAFLKTLSDGYAP